MKLRQTFYNHLYVPAFIILFGLIIVFVSHFFGFENNVKLQIVCIYYAFYSIPAPYLHIEYTIINWSQKVTLTDNEILLWNNKYNKTYFKRI